MVPFTLARDHGERGKTGPQQYYKAARLREALEDAINGDASQRMTSQLWTAHAPFQGSAILRISHRPNQVYTSIPVLRLSRLPALVDSRTDCTNITASRSVSQITNKSRELRQNRQVPVREGLSQARHDSHQACCELTRHEQITTRPHDDGSTAFA